MVAIILWNVIGVTLSCLLAYEDNWDAFFVTLLIYPIGWIVPSIMLYKHIKN